MKRLIALLLCLVLFLCGCETGKKDDRPEEEEATLEVEHDTAENQTNLVLYFPSVDDPERLASEKRPVSVSTFESPVDVALEELLKGPEDPELTTILPQNLRLIMTEQSSNLVTVHFSDELLTLADRELLLAKLSVINTLTSIQGVEYVSLMCAEKEVPVFGYTSGAEGGFVGTLDEKIAEIEAARDSDAKTRKITLYFQDGTQSYLLPEVRTVGNEEDMVHTIMAELLAGPLDTARCAPVLRSDLTLLSEPKRTKLSDGSVVLTVDLSSDEEFWQVSSGKKMMRVGAIVLSLLGNLPDVDYVSVQMDSVPINRYVSDQSTYLNAALFRRLVGDTMALYYPDETGTMLVEVQRTVDQTSIGHAREILQQLLLAPKIAENPEAFPLPVKWGPQDVLSLRIQNGLLTLNLSRTACDELMALEEEEQFICIYSIVNSLCTTEGISRVRFLRDGERITDAGALSLDNPLLPNVGLVY